MNDTLFVTIAEIAGVFVGFAALISVTERSGSGAAQVGQIRAVVTDGLLVVVAALIPVGLAAYDFGDHATWVVASVVYLILIWTVIAVALRSPSNRRLVADQARSEPLMTALFWVFEIPIQVPLLLIVLGVNPDLDRAFYLTSLLFHLFEAVFVLAQLVYARVDRRLG